MVLIVHELRHDVRDNSEFLLGIGPADDAENVFISLSKVGWQTRGRFKIKRPMAIAASVVSVSLPLPGMEKIERR